MNTGAPWPEPSEAEHRVLVMQTKLHQWAMADPGRRFDDVFNLVYDPAFLVVAWSRVRGNKGARTAGVDGIAPRSVGPGAEKLLVGLRDDLKARRFRPQRVREKTIPKAGGKVRKLGIPTVADRVVFTTGTRRSEALGLSWADVDLDSGWARIRRTLVVVGNEPQFGSPKSSHGRTVALATSTIATLRDWRRSQAQERLAWGPAYDTDWDCVFSRENGEPWHPDTITSAFRRAVERSGLPRIRLHDARHTWATLALANGVPLKVVADALGHASIQVTADVYSHVTPSLAADAVETVAAAVTWV